MSSSDEITDRDEMNAMDQILLVNRSKWIDNCVKMYYFLNNTLKYFFLSVTELKFPRGMTLKEGDIAHSYIRSALICPGNACLWPKAIDGFVYIPYIMSPLYGTV